MTLIKLNILSEINYLRRMLFISVNGNVSNNEGTEHNIKKERCFMTQRLRSKMLWARSNNQGRMLECIS